MSRSRSPERPPDRPLYVGNYEYEMPETEIRRIFEEYGDVERIDMKTFAFVYMSTERQAERAIRKLDNKETKEAERHKEARPSSTLFVVNFDVARIRERDVERHFEAYGRIKRVEIKKSYAFVQFENVEDAEYALKKTHLSNLDGRTITVEYVQNEDPNAARLRGPPPREDNDRGYPARRSPSPRGRDYDRSPVRRSRSPPRRSRSRSPVRRSRSRSPVRRGRSYSR